ncbi:MAG: hypothetical protein ACYCYM_03210 [Saccharofermentanales bacterium]
MKKFASIAAVLAIVLSSGIRSFAFIPYTGYTYDEFGRAIPSASGYEPTAVVYSDSEGKVLFDGIEDMYIDSEGNIYLLDSEKGAIIKMNQQYEILQVLGSFTRSDGSAYALNKPRGFYITEDRIYIADTENNTIAVSDPQGNILQLIGKPQNEIFPQEKDFKPISVISDSVGNIYTVISGVFHGAPTFDSKGEFIEFFGSDRVELSARLLADLMWKKLVNEKMRDRLARYVPIEYTNFDIDSDNFIYTCAARPSSIGELRKINPAGVNIWMQKNFGDIEVNYRKGRQVDTFFTDVEISGRGFLYALDDSRKRIFMYDQEGDLTFAFGGKGNQKGTFQMPICIESYGDKIYIYDSSKNSITEYMPTEYGNKVIDAIEMFQDGSYIESKVLWEDVLRRNSNNAVAYIGIGKALYHTGNYKEAMAYLTLGGDKWQESLAYEQYRTGIIRSKFGWIAALTGLTVLCAIIFINRRRISLYCHARTPFKKKTSVDLTETGRKQ